MIISRGLCIGFPNKIVPRKQMTPFTSVHFYIQFITTCLIFGSIVTLDCWCLIVCGVFIPSQSDALRCSGQSHGVTMRATEMHCGSVTLRVHRQINWSQLSSVDAPGVHRDTQEEWGVHTVPPPTLGTTLTKLWRRCGALSDVLSVLSKWLVLSPETVTSCYRRWTFIRNMETFVT